MADTFLDMAANCPVPVLSGTHSSLAFKTIASVTETSFKMASTLCQKWLTIFLSKSSKCCKVRTIRFYSNFTSMWSKYFLNYVWKDLRLPMSAQKVGESPTLGKFRRKILKGRGKGWKGEGKGKGEEKIVGKGKERQGKNGKWRGKEGKL